jgi:hypothetical protein
MKFFRLGFCLPVEQGKPLAFCNQRKRVLKPEFGLFLANLYKPVIDRCFKAEASQRERQRVGYDAALAGRNQIAILPRGNNAVRTCFYQREISPRFGKKCRRLLVEIDRHGLAFQNLEHLRHHLIMDVSGIASEQWRRTCLRSCYKDDLFPLVDLDNLPSPSRKDDGHTRRQDVVDRQGAKILALFDKAKLLRRLEHGVKAVMLNQFLALSAKEKQAIVGLLDQRNIGTSDLSQHGEEQGGVDCMKRPLAA